MSDTYTITTWYKFMPLPDTAAVIKQRLESYAAAHDILGLVLLAPEGINATVSGTPAAITDFKNELTNIFGDLTFKDSPGIDHPFKRFKVSLREEIVQLNRTDIQPSGQSHLSPEAWDTLLAHDETVVIDVRNWYETKLGSFTGAIDPQTEKFSDFPDWVQQSTIPTDAPIGIFCTGGIRCEKAAVAMEKLGYTNVHQLDGGILNYLEQRPNKNFQGECFVFDHRMAVDQELRPSTTYGCCPHCGNGGDLVRHCAVCSTDYKTCAECDTQQTQATCSKRCRNQAQITTL